MRRIVEPASSTAATASSRGRGSRVVRWVSAAILAAGCAAASPSCKSAGISLSVDLRTDYTPGREFASVVTEVVPDGGGSLRSEQPIDDAKGGVFVEGARVADFGDVQPGGLLVRVKVFSKEGAPLVERLARLSVSSDYALTVVVTRNCEGITCPAPDGDPALATCDRGKCVRPECTASTPQFCDPAECAKDADCHPDVDCVSGRCIAGTCLFLPDDGLCKATQTCDANHGCTPPLGPTCTPKGETETSCDDGLDDDCDGKIDCLDPDCDGKTCEDGDLCTEGETCSKAACNGGAAKTCDDGDPCTDDACDPKKGCTTSPKTGGTCEDGDACTEGDTCVDGKCVGGSAASCDDGNPCTDDACDAKAGCTHVERTGACDDGDACTDGDTCVAGVCKPGPAKSCSDGNPCTDDVCDPKTGCSNPNNTAPCDDGTFCNGADTCKDGTCSVHAGNPCGASCDETIDKCVGCLVDADCGPTTFGAWGACGGFASTCDTTGTQSRTVTAPKCVAGACTYPTSSESQACTRGTDGLSCGAVTYGTWSACGGYSSTCDETGTRSRSVTTPTCSGGACVNAGSTETGSCTRNTDGSSCGTTSYGAWSSCGGFSNACDTTGTRSRSKTTYACAAGSCKSTAGSENQSCTRSVANGTSCGSGKYCCSGTCFSKNDRNHCSSCGIACPSGSSCNSIGGGNYSCTCTSNAQCVNAGFGSGATCWSPSGTMYCNCQCTTNNCCAGGADCYKPSGLNYCSY